MESLAGAIEAEIEAEAIRTGFSGVVRVDKGATAVVCAAYGLADRAFGVPVTAATRFGVASIAKGFTALTVMRLVESGALALQTPARSVLGADLPLVADDVTIEHLLAHRSGIGDYLDEDAASDITDHVMPVPVHRLASTPDYLPVLDGHAQVFAPGTDFSYNNAGFVVLALIAERVAGTAFAELVRRTVCEPAGMAATAFLRSDELPGDAARGYLAADGLRTNVLHLPVLGSGDGGLYTTVDDLHRFWTALHAGRIVAPGTVVEMTRARSDWPEENRRYGLGFHLGASDDTVFLEGYDAGVSCWSQHQPSTGLTWTVISNWTRGAWPMKGLLARRLGTAVDLTRP